MFLVFAVFSIPTNIHDAIDDDDDDDDHDYNPAVAPVAPGTGRHPFPLGAAGSGD